MSRSTTVSAFRPARRLASTLLFAFTLAAQTYDVSGVVVQSITNAPLSKVTLSLSSTNDRANPLFAAISDGEGKFHIEGVPPGKYSLLAQRNGFLIQALDQHGSFATAVIVGPNSNTSQILFRMRPSTGLIVSVVDEENQPVRHAQVMLFGRHVANGESAFFQASGGSTSDTGRATFRSLEPGTYYAVVVAQPWYAQRGMLMGQDPRQPPADPPRTPLEVAYPVTWYGGSTDFASAAPIAVDSGSQPTVTVALQPVPCVRVRIPFADPDRQRRNIVQVYAELPNGARIGIAAFPMHVADGILLMGLAPGRYNFAVDNPLVSSEPGKTVRLQQSRDNHQLLLKSDVAGDMTLPLSPAPLVLLTGKVVSDTPLPPGNWPLRIQSDASAAERSEVTIYLDENLAFSGPEKFLSPGRYRVVSAFPQTEVTSIALNGQPPKPGNTVTISAGGASLTVNLGQQQMAQVNGFVTEQDKPRPGVPVYLLPQGGKTGTAEVFQDQSDSDGSFSVNVKAGKYIGVAIENGYDLEYAKPDVMKPYLAAGTAFEVGVDRRVQVKLEVQPKQ